jgi:Cof subfamily protein (haloacid dehalogenase superfamily)
MKILFLDIDGTLCEPGEQVSDVTIEALHRAQAKGNKIFISTGRNVPSIQPFVLSIGFDGIIASAGGHIIADGRVLEDKKMPPELLEHALKVFNKYDVSYMLETDQGTYADVAKHLKKWENNLATANSEMKRMMVQLLEGLGMLSLSEFDGQPVYKICFIGNDEESVVAAIQELGPEFETVLQDNMVPDQPRINGETMQKGVDKGIAVREICDYYGIGLEDAIAFGDSGNDLPMLDVAGTAVVMGNAAPSVKEHADVVCESCADNGIAHQLERMGLV